MNSYQSSPKDYGLSNKDVDSRSKQFQKLRQDQQGLKKTYDSFFEKKQREDLLGNGGPKQETV